MKKLNISGGEPFLKPEFIGEIFFHFCKEELHLESCSIVNNDSKVKEKWLDTYGHFDAEVNIKLGRSEKNGTAKHVGHVFQVADWCKQRGIKLKINSVITKLNWEEDMNASIEELDPVRWKNTGTESGSLRDARDLVITDEQFQAFLERHESKKSLLPEDNKAMQDSYLLLDKELRFLNCEGGTKRPGRSVLKVGVQEALKDTGFDNSAFLDRGGIFNWTKEKTVVESLDW
ncbi:hypothetical protein K439DRAFT_1649119 [Ramaria rubella]|nr:hypothetical protein K439DRAFT_1649119 [Ramaria rubella]